MKNVNKNPVTEAVCSNHGWAKLHELNVKGALDHCPISEEDRQKLNDELLLEKEDLRQAGVLKLLFEQAMSEYIKFSETEDPYNFSFIMLTFPMKEGEFRSPEKHALKELRGRVFLGSDINPNGVTGPDDIARTWNINFEVSATCRYYRHKYWGDDVIEKIYVYGRSPEDTVAQFIEWYKDVPEWIRGLYVS